MSWYHGPWLGHRHEKEHRAIQSEWQLPGLEPRRHVRPPQVEAEVVHTSVSRRGHATVVDLAATLGDRGLDARHPWAPFNDRVVRFPILSLWTHRVLPPK